MTYVTQNLEVAPAPVPSRDRLHRTKSSSSPLALSAFVMILSELAMGVALPQVMDDLGVTAVAGQWLTMGERRSSPRCSSPWSRPSVRSSCLDAQE